MAAVETEQLVTADAYHVAFERVAWFLSQTGGGSIAFAAAQSQRLIEQVCRRWQEQLWEKGIAVAVVHLRQQDDRPFAEQLRQAAKEADALIVPNLSEVVASAADRLTELNFAREELIALDKPILFCLYSEHLPLIAQKAADLYSQRALTTTFFETPEPFVPNGQTLQSLEHHTELPDKEALGMRAALLQKQLAQAENLHISKQKIAADIALPLAETYALLGSYREAEELQKTYAPYFPKTVKALQSLATIARRANRYDEAIQYYWQALACTKESSFEQADIQNDLADVYRHLGGKENLRQAQDLLQKAYATCLTLMGERHYYTQKILGNLLALYVQIRTGKSIKQCTQEEISDLIAGFGAWLEGGKQEVALRGL
ncbi:tetratricopeptide repeat protein [Rhodoflexus sp.]